MYDKIFVLLRDKRVNINMRVPAIHGGSVLFAACVSPEPTVLVKRMLLWGADRSHCNDNGDTVMNIFGNDKQISEVFQRD